MKTISTIALLLISTVLFSCKKETIAPAKTLDELLQENIIISNIQVAEPDKGEVVVYYEVTCKKGSNFQGVVIYWTAEDIDGKKETQEFDLDPITSDKTDKYYTYIDLDNSYKPNTITYKVGFE